MEKTLNMDGKIKEISERIRSLRELSDFSIEEMAVNTGISIEDYKQLEDGEKDFTFTFIYKCAQCFGVDIADILKGTSPTLSAYSVIRKGEGLPIARRQGFVYHNLAPMFKNKMGEPFWVRIPYSKEDEEKEIKTNFHEGHEVSYVLKGSVKAKIGNNIVILNEGDTIYYDSAMPHGMVATGGKDCEFFTVIINPEGDSYLFSQPEEMVTEVSTELKHPDKTGAIYENYVETVVDAEGMLKNIEFKNTEHFNFAFDIVDALAQKCPDKLAMLHLDKDKNERRFSFREMSERSNQTANYFKKLGIKRGDKVMLVLKRHYQFWLSILALHKIGAIAVPATHLLVQKDFEYRFNAGQVSAIVCTADGDVTHQVDLACAASPTLKVKIIANGEKEGWNNFDVEMKKFSKSYLRPQGFETPGGEDAMLMFFTSGTTGYPKIATHNYLYPLGHFITAKYWHNVNPNGLHLTIADTGWGKALWGKLYGQWLCEAAILTYDFEKFDANDILPLFKQCHITTFCAPPTMYRFFIKEDLSKYDLSSLEYATVAGEALNPEVYNKFYEATGVKLMEGFGQTETTLVVFNMVGTKPKPGSMGKPSPLFDSEIMLPDGKQAGVGEIGEIVIRTDKGKPCGLFTEYFMDKEKTLEVYHDNVYHTGDTAWMDEDGYYWYIGRTDDLIKSSGYRIGPFEIESVIMELPYVLECAITAAPDEIRGQVVKATIVLTKGTVASDVLKKEIQTYVKVHTAPYKYPRIVEFVEELPKTISGKIRRVELRDNN